MCGELLGPLCSQYPNTIPIIILFNPFGRHRQPMSTNWNAEVGNQPVICDIACRSCFEGLLIVKDVVLE